MKLLRYSVSLILLLLLFSDTGFSQTVLKKKSLIERLDQISTAVDNGDYEMAINWFWSTNEIIAEEDVPKKRMESYQKMKLKLSEIRAKFDSNHERTVALMRLYDAHHCCDALELLSMDLNKTNSYSKTRTIQEKATPTLKIAKKSCDDYHLAIPKWNELLEKKEFERLLDLQVMSVIGSEIDCIHDEDRVEVQLIQGGLESQYKLYENVKSGLNNLNRSIETIDFNNLNYAKSEESINEISSQFELIQSDSDKLNGEFPKLKNDIDIMSSTVELTLSKLRQFSIQNKPLTASEVSAKVFSGKRISPEFIKSNCTRIHYTQRNEAIFNLDVFRYFDLREYDSELKKTVFKRTEEYKQKLEELKALKAKQSNTVYYFTEKELFDGVDYDISKRGFTVTLGENYTVLGTAAANPPKGFSDAILLKSLPTKQVAKDILQGRAMEHEEMFIPMDESCALELENNKGGDTYFLFKYNGFETLKYVFYASGDWYNIEEPMLTTNKVRMVVFDIGGKACFDKVY